MEFLVKKTSELTQAEQKGILDLFNDIFHEHRSPKEFLNQYQNNVLGFSYHSLIIENESIVGANAFVPGYYIVQGEKHLFAVSIDTMIRKSHRGIENFYDLVNNAFERLKADGVAFVMGFPNDASYPVFTATNLMPDIGRLDTFCLPMRIGGIKNGLKFLNGCSNLFCRCWLTVSSFFASEKICTLPIHRDSETFNLTRYKRMDGDYRQVNLPGLEFFYKLKTIEGIRTATLIDVTQKSEKNFCRAARYIVQHEKQHFDSLLFVGHLPFANIGMIKVPKKFEPKTIYFNGISLQKDALDFETICNIGHWDVNLADFDLI
jgi:Acetyltransferase (GNAT) domain